MRYLTLLLLFASSISFANHMSTSTQTTPSDSPLITVTCPAIKALKKDETKMTWSAGGKWKSYGTSFVNKIASFSGAQWNGVNLGQVICVYRGNEQTDFPVLLVYGTLANEPHDGAWSKNLGGYRNCTSKKQNRCAFTVNKKPQPGNIYKEAEQLKYNTNTISNPGY